MLTCDGQSPHSHTDKAFVSRLHMKTQSGLKTIVPFTSVRASFFFYTGKREYFLLSSIIHIHKQAERADKSAEFCEFCGCSCMDGFSLDCTHWCYLCQSQPPLRGCIHTKKVKQCYSAISRKIRNKTEYGACNITSWHMNRAMAAERSHVEEQSPSWQQGNFKLGHGTKHLITVPICNCSILLLLFLYCLCVCTDSLNWRHFLIFK